jgi:hypothetical protein
MSTYTLRVRVAEGQYVPVTVQAQSPTYAKMMVEAQYGPGSCVGFL